MPRKIKTPLSIFDDIRHGDEIAALDRLDETISVAGLPDAEEPQRVRQARELMRRALASGVTVAMGSDAGVFAHGDNARELELMVDYGMTPAAALAAATTVAARVLGLEDKIGRIAPGFAADLLAVEGNPLSDVSSLRRPRVVLKAGALVFRPGHL